MFLDNKKLLNAILHSKVINTQLEVEFILSCMEDDSCQSPPKPLETNNKKKDTDKHKDTNELKDTDEHKDTDEPKDTNEQKEINEQKDTNEHKDKKVSSPILPLILQYTQLEESNFKSQFFITRGSFQVIYLFHIFRMEHILIMSVTYQVC